MGVSEPLSGSYLTNLRFVMFLLPRTNLTSFRTTLFALGTTTTEKRHYMVVSFRPLRPMPPPPFSISSSSRPARVDLVLEVSGLRRSLT